MYRGRGRERDILYTGSSRASRLPFHLFPSVLPLLVMDATALRRIEDGLTSSTLTDNTTATTVTSAPSGRDSGLADAAPSVASRGSGPADAAPSVASQTNPEGETMANLARERRARTIREANELSQHVGVWLQNGLQMESTEERRLCLMRRLNKVLMAFKTLETVEAIWEEVATTVVDGVGVDEDGEAGQAGYERWI